MKNKFLPLIFSAALATAVASPKPYPRGIIDLPVKISAKAPIGTIDAHPWLNPNVDGVRIRTGWSNTETASGVYNWVQIDECLANAVTSGKFIGLDVFSGTDAPAWLMGGATFVDGSIVATVATLNSITANFTTADIGRVIASDGFPAGTTVASITSSIAVQTSAAAIKTSTSKKATVFSILTRNTGSAAFRVLTAPDSGLIPVPWDPVAKAAWKRFIVASAARYDANPQLHYMVMAGFQQTADCSLATTQPDIDFFDASAAAAGYLATDILPAGLVAWEATVKEMVAQYMTSFPNTPLIISGGKPYGGPAAAIGQIAMQDIFDWGVATYPGRFGIMNAQVMAASGPKYFLNAAILNNHLTEPTGIEFICDSATDVGVARLSNSSPYGTDPLLSAYDAMNNTFTAALSFGVGYIEVYEIDILNPAYQTMLATQRAALGIELPPLAPTNLHIL